MNIKLIGFGLAVLGIILIFIATPKILGAIPFLGTLSPKYLIVPGVILVGMGIIIVMTQSEGGKKHAYAHKTKMGTEVPIFHNKEIIGYRVTK